MQVVKHVFCYVKRTVDASHEIVPEGKLLLKEFFDSL